MEFSSPELIQLIERASTLTERLEFPFVAGPAAENEPAIKTRLEQWRKVIGYGQPDKFDRRLAWDGLDIAAVSQVIGAGQWPVDQPLPIWTETLQAVLRAAALGTDSLPVGLVDPADPLPFEEVFLPFIGVARQKLIEQTGPAYALLSQTAQVSLERSLLTRLTTICAQAMTLEFSLVRLQKQPDSLQPWLQLAGQSSQTLYHSFVEELLGGKLAVLFQKYPVLARLVATIIDFWVEASAEFFQRLATDLPRIQEIFSPATALGQVKATQPALSDPHDRGRSVMALQFDAGLKLVYKPRNLGLEVVYFQLLAWLNEQGTPLPFKLLTILNCPNHGWVEYVSPSPCQEEAEARRYYRRAGMLLALLYTLRATDCHFQNIIACADQPVIIDVDMLITPAINWLPQQNPDLAAQVLANQKLTDSVLWTAMLPRWEIGAGQSLYDISGLGGLGEQDFQERVPVWANINRDSMAVAYVPGKIQSYTNAPLPSALNLTPAACHEELILGFQEMYRLLLARRADLLAPAGPLAALAEQSPRFMLRNTQGYFQTLQKSLQPKFLRDGADRDIQLDVLSRSMLHLPQRPLYWPLLASERQALAQLDIPYFAAPATATSFSAWPGETIESFFRQSSYERVISRVHDLSETDLAQQVEIIQSATYARLASKPDAVCQIEPSSEIWPPTSPSWPRLTGAGLVEAAIPIAAELRQRAISSADGHSLVWLGLDYLHEAQRYQFQPLNFGFYGGNGGIALFLAALARVTGDASWRHLALSTLHPLRYGLAELLSVKSGGDVSKILQATTLGAAQGLGSLFYVLAETGHLLDEPSLLAEASHLATFITPEIIAADTKFDVLLGAAGSILGLLALHRRTADPLALAQAAKCGQHLLAKRVVTPSGQRAWPTLQGKFLAGFAHGSAGVAYALLQLYLAGQKENLHFSSFREAAGEAIAYEQTLFNWPIIGSGWQNGAAGIGLARLGGLAALDTPTIRQDIQAALQVSRHMNTTGVDHLCWGNFGRLELLLVAAAQLDCPELAETAQQQAAWLLNRAKQAGSFRLFSDSTRPLYHPGLLRGTAGIGYQLLRLAAPDTIPSILW